MMGGDVFVVGVLVGAVVVGGASMGYFRWARAAREKREAGRCTPPAVLRLLDALTDALWRGEVPSGLAIDSPNRKLKFGLLRVSVGAKLEEGTIHLVDESGLDALKEEEVFGAATYRAVCPGADFDLNRRFFNLAEAAFGPVSVQRRRHLEQIDSEARALKDGRWRIVRR